VELPLFPLSTVLHPGLPISLHVFEDRYWEMFGRALDGERRFGWSLSSTAMRSAGPPSTTRSAAWPRSATSGATPTGRLEVVARDERRFRIEGVTQAAQYIANVATLGESAGERATEPIVPVARLFNPLCHHPGEIVGESEIGQVDLPNDRSQPPPWSRPPPGRPADKQNLLAIASASERLRTRGALRRELSLLEQLGIAGPARPTLPFSLK
jgi:hypothetical protein